MRMIRFVPLLFLVVALSSVASAVAQELVPLRTLPGLSQIRLIERTSELVSFNMRPNDAVVTTRRSGKLSRSNRDFQTGADEFYDIYYSDADGTFNVDGGFLTITSNYDGEFGSGLNVVAVELHFGSGIEYASTVASFVALGGTAQPGTADNALGNSRDTWTLFGDTSGQPSTVQLRLTLGFESTRPSLIDLSGNWEAEYNWQQTGWNAGMRVCLRQLGNTVSGTYAWTADGREKRGVFIESELDRNRLNYAFSGSDCAGEGSFDIATDGSRMSGGYRCAGGGTGEWVLVRATTDAPGLCERLAAEAAAADRPGLVSIEILDADTTGDGGKMIAIGQSFRVRLTYEEAAGADFTETVTVNTSGGGTETVEVKVKAYAKVADSAPILIRPLSP